MGPIALSRRTTIHTAALRIALFAAVLAFGVLAFAQSAHALAINDVKYTGPVAYELKSLQTTRFYCSVDTPGVWATLRIKDGEGRVVKTIYSGPINDANTWFYFPLWNGLDNNGKRLYTSSWNWELTVNKGGQTAVKTGKITVSKIAFFVTGRAQYPNVDLFSRYMVPGNANIYVRTSSPVSFDAFQFAIAHEGGYQYESRIIYNDVANSPVNSTVYLRGSTAPRARGMHVLGAAAYEDVSYYITVIQ